MFCRSLLFILAATLGGVGVASATEILTPPSTGKLRYEFHTGNKGTWTYIDASTIERSNGTTLAIDKWGNQLRITGKTQTTFTPHDGQLPERPMEVGLKWEHKFQYQGMRESYTRSKTCQVAARESLTTKAGTFKDAWKVECTTQRLDRQFPTYETSWYSSRGRILLQTKEHWAGTSPGSSSMELIEQGMEILSAQ